MAEATSGATGDGRRDIELVVVAYRSRAQVEEMLAGLPDDLPVAVVDNSDGADGLGDVVTARPGGRYLAGGGVGYPRAANRGARTSGAEYVVFVNPDTRPTADQIAALVEDVATDARLSASAGTLLDGDGRAQIGVGGWEPTLLRALVHSAGLHKFLPSAGLAARPALDTPIEVDWVSGGCMAVRRETFLDLGGFDADFYVYNEDMAFGRTSRERGLRQRLRTDVHVTGSSGGSGAPSLEMLRLRGASMNRYLQKFRSRPAATAIIAVYGAGYVVRTVEQLLLRNRRRAGEHWALAKGCFTGRATVGGRVVTGG